MTNGHDHPQTAAAVHTIRLRGPWRYEPLYYSLRLANGTSVPEDRGPLPPAGRVKMPSDWGLQLGADFRGRVRLLRSFARPTGLAAHERVDLLIEQVDAFGCAELNGQHLGLLDLAAGPARFDVTRILAPRNQLVVEVELPRLNSDSAPLPRAGREHLPGGLIGEVRLEISDCRRATV